MCVHYKAELGTMPQKTNEELQTTFVPEDPSQHLAEKPARKFWESLEERAFTQSQRDAMELECISVYYNMDGGAGGPESECWACGRPPENESRKSHPQDQQLQQVPPQAISIPHHQEISQQIKQRNPQKSPSALPTRVPLYPQQELPVSLPQRIPVYKRQEFPVLYRRPPPHAQHQSPHPLFINKPPESQGSPGYTVQGPILRKNLGSQVQAVYTRMAGTASRHMSVSTSVPPEEQTRRDGTSSWLAPAQARWGHRDASTVDEDHPLMVHRSSSYHKPRMSESILHASSFRYRSNRGAQTKNETDFVRPGRAEEEAIKASHPKAVGIMIPILRNSAFQKRKTLADVSKHEVEFASDSESDSETASETASSDTSTRADRDLVPCTAHSSTSVKPDNRFKGQTFDSRYQHRNERRNDLARDQALTKTTEYSRSSPSRVPYRPSPPNTPPEYCKDKPKGTISNRYVKDTPTHCQPEYVRHRHSRIWCEQATSPTDLRPRKHLVDVEGEDQSRHHHRHRKLDKRRSLELSEHRDEAEDDFEQGNVSSETIIQKSNSGRRREPRIPRRDERYDPGYIDRDSDLKSRSHKSRTEMSSGHDIKAVEKRASHRTSTSAHREEYHTPCIRHPRQTKYPSDSYEKDPRVCSTVSRISHDPVHSESKYGHGSDRYSSQPVSDADKHSQRHEPKHRSSSTRSHGDESDRVDKSRPSPPRRERKEAGHTPWKEQTCRSEHERRDRSRSKAYLDDSHESPPPTHKEGSYRYELLHSHRHSGTKEPEYYRRRELTPIPEAQWESVYPVQEEDEIPQLASRDFDRRSPHESTHCLQDTWSDRVELPERPRCGHSRTVRRYGHQRDPKR